MILVRWVVLHRKTVHYSHYESRYPEHRVSDRVMLRIRVISCVSVRDNLEIDVFDLTQCTGPTLTF